MGAIICVLTDMLLCTNIASIFFLANDFSKQEMAYMIGKFADNAERHNRKSQIYISFVANCHSSSYTSPSDTWERCVQLCRVYTLTSIIHFSTCYTKKYFFLVLCVNNKRNTIIGPFGYIFCIIQVYNLIVNCNVPKVYFHITNIILYRLCKILEIIVYSACKKIWLL